MACNLDAFRPTGVTLDESTAHAEDVADDYLISELMCPTEIVQSLTDATLVKKKIDSKIQCGNVHKHS